MNWTVARPWLGTVARLLLGVVWIWASLAKLADPLKFVQAVRAYDATPEWLSKGIGYGLPVLELCLGVVLVLGVTVRIAAAASAVLFVVFAIALIQASVRDIQIQCGCFGGGGATDASTTYTLDILRDLALLAVAVYLVMWSYTRLSVEEFLARHDHVEMPSAKRMRMPEHRRRYEAQVAAKQKEARSRTLYVDGAISLVIVLVTLVGVGVQAGRAKIGNVQFSANASGSGVTFGKKAAATVDIYEDFGCPICKNFEAAVATKLDHDVRANLAQVRFHPISILDGNSPNKYSTRAGNAALCVSDVSVDAFVAYHNLLFAGAFQPKEGTPGPGSTALTTLARKAGLTQTQSTSLSDCILSSKYVPLLKQLTDTASQDGVNATPTVMVNGKQVAATSSALFAAIAKANVGHTPTPSVTPSPSATAPSSSTVPSSASPSASPSPTSSSKSK